VAEGNLPQQSSGSQPTPVAAPRPKTAFYTRLLGLLIALLLVLGGIWGWVHFSRQSNLPDLSTISIATADPEIADALSKARGDVEANRASAESWGRYAMTLHAHNYLSESVICYEAAGNLDKNNWYWPHLRGSILETGEDPALALLDRRRAADLAPGDAPPRLSLADLLQTLGHLDEAALEYKKALAANRQDGHANLGLGQVAFARKDYRAALAHLFAVENNPYARKRSCVLRLIAYERLEQLDAADKERALLSKFPKDAEDPPWPDRARDAVMSLQVGLKARLQRGPDLLGQGKIGQAVSLLRETTRRYPDSDLAWATLGYALDVARDFPGAENAFKKAVELAKENPDHWFNLGYFYQTKLRYQAAVDAYRQAIRLRPTAAQTHFNLGECLEELNDRKNAADAFRTALRYRPDMEAAKTHLTKLESK
jgi:tetratricopeptide (TPR) repeat protein